MGYGWRLLVEALVGMFCRHWLSSTTFDCAAN
jgi:hypothetical protein